ncbi:MAG: tripartite tricarboxylate transporter TctB family protein [Candidatus Rokuibacteriota bacterium]
MVPLSRDGVAGLIGLVGSATLYVSSLSLPQPALVPIGPGFYPRFLFAVTGVLSLLLLVTDLRHRTAPPRRTDTRYRLVVLSFLVFAGYVFAMPWLGYRVSTFLFVGVVSAIIEPPRGARWWALLALALLTTVATYLVFERYLSVLLPRGRLTGF